MQASLLDFTWRGLSVLRFIPLLKQEVTSTFCLLFFPPASTGKGQFKCCCPCIIFTFHPSQNELILPLYSGLMSPASPLPSQVEAERLDEFLGIAVWGQVAIAYGEATEAGAKGCVLQYSILGRSQNQAMTHQLQMVRLWGMVQTGGSNQNRTNGLKLRREMVPEKKSLNQRRLDCS